MHYNGLSRLTKKDCVHYLMPWHLISSKSQCIKQPLGIFCSQALINNLRAILKYAVSFWDDVSSSVWNYFRLFCQLRESHGLPLLSMMLQLSAPCPTLSPISTELGCRAVFKRMQRLNHDSTKSGCQTVAWDRVYRELSYIGNRWPVPMRKWVPDHSVVSTPSQMEF